MFGVLKTPVAAGRGTGGLHFDILPGQPKASIMLYRVRSVEGGIMMPEFGRTQVDEEGAAILSEWIESMSPVERALGQAGLIGIVTDVKPEELSTLAQQALTQGDSKRGEEVFQRRNSTARSVTPLPAKAPTLAPIWQRSARKSSPNTLSNRYFFQTGSSRRGFVPSHCRLKTDWSLPAFRSSTTATMSCCAIRSEATRGSPRPRSPRVSFGGSLMPTNLVAALQAQRVS